MIINSPNLESISTGFNTAFNKGWAGGDPIYKAICMMAKSTGKDEAYA